MRRPTRLGLALWAAFAVVLVLTVATAKAADVPDRPFAIANMAMAWPCAPQAVYIDRASAPAPADVQAAVDAVATFSKATGRSWPISTDPAAPVHITWTTAASGDQEGARTVLAGTATTYVGASIEVSRTYRPGWERSILLHELGHLGGLAHVADQAEVMGLYPNQPHTRYEVGDLVGLLIASRTCR